MNKYRVEYRSGRHFAIYTVEATDEADAVQAANVMAYCDLPAPELVSVRRVTEKPIEQVVSCLPF